MTGFRSTEDRVVTGQIRTCSNTQTLILEPQRDRRVSFRTEPIRDQEVYLPRLSYVWWYPLFKFQKWMSRTRSSLGVQFSRRETEVGVRCVCLYFSVRLSLSLFVYYPSLYIPLFHPQWNSNIRLCLQTECPSSSFRLSVQPIRPLYWDSRAKAGDRTRRTYTTFWPWTQFSLTRDEDHTFSIWNKFYLRFRCFLICLSMSFVNELRKRFLLLLTGMVCVFYYIC